MEKLHAKLASEFYDKIIGLHSREFNCKNIQYRHWLDILASKLAKGGAVLDLGCGNGRAVKYFVDRGFRGVGIDISDKMLEMAKKHVPEGKFFKNEFTEIEFGPNSFDAVVSFFALNHIPKNQFKKVVIICRKVLKKTAFCFWEWLKAMTKAFSAGFMEKRCSFMARAMPRKNSLKS